MTKCALFLAAASLLCAVCAGDRSSTCDAGECPAATRVHASSLIQVQRDALRKQHAVESSKKWGEDDSWRADPPCQCEHAVANWVHPQKRAPRCLFVDLGSADGDTYKQFLQGAYGNTKNCPSNGSHQAILVEANPIFQKNLRALEAGSDGRVKSFASTAAYMCEGTTNFFLDTVDVRENFWGSSMSPNARDVQRSGRKKVEVPLMNIVKLIAENALPEDFVIVKMDIEGSEWDILPCLSKSPAANLVDALYVEKHTREWSLARTTDADYGKAVAALQARGVVTPEYDSPML